MAQAKFIVTKKRCQQKGGEKMYICVDSRDKCLRQRAMTGHRFMHCFRTLSSIMYTHYVIVGAYLR
jgi:hypothetical protein